MRRRFPTASRSSTVHWSTASGRRVRSAARSARRWCTSSAISSVSTTTTSKPKGIEALSCQPSAISWAQPITSSPLNNHPISLNAASAADAPCEEVALTFEGIGVRLWRAVELERFVDAAALLRADDAPEPPYWMHLWPGALAAARQMARASEVGPEARVLELGCGLGLPALVAAQRGASAMATDRLAAPLRFVLRSAAASGCALAAVQMDWRAPAPRGVIWLADSVNTARNGLADRLQAAGFAVGVSSVREWEEGRPVWVRMIEACRA